MRKCFVKLAVVLISFAILLSVITGLAWRGNRTTTAYDKLLDTNTPQPAATAQATAQTTTTAAQETAETISQNTSLVYSYDWDSDEAEMLAKIAMAEAESEDTEGKALVILVVLNRVWSDGFPDSIEDVIFQTGQFSTTEQGGRYWTTEPDEDCYAALALVAQGWDESQGATFFEASYNTDTWHKDNLQFLFQHGAHLFYTTKGE